MESSQLARLFALLGIIFLVLAGIVYVLSRFEIPLGRLPGDIVIKRDNFTCMVPIVSSIVVSIVLTLVFNLVLRLIQK